MTDVMFKNLCSAKLLLHAWEVVKQKGSAGGIDGMSILDIDGDIDVHIKQLQIELAKKEWKPQPYKTIHIPKKNNELRKLGLLSVKDKIVQQALKILVEPRLEKIFLSNSYGYRPQKGHTKAVNFARNCIQNKKCGCILKLDIDNYFDTINHDILFKRLQSIVPDMEVLRLIQLCTKMGMVNNKMKWDQISSGVAQGAVLSPMLANFYLHPFDQFVLTRTERYVRYADDFLICCADREEADKILMEATDFLQTRLKLKLNEPKIYDVSDGVEFLGIKIDRGGVSVTDKKKEELAAKIIALNWSENDFSARDLKALKGVKNYYAVLLPEVYLEFFDDVLIKRLHHVAENDWRQIPNKTTFANALKKIEFYSNKNILQKSRIVSDIVVAYLNKKNEDVCIKNEQLNNSLVQKRKNEYRKKEIENTEMVITTPGTFLGLSNRGLSLKSNGVKQKGILMVNVQHITVMSAGVSISSNAVTYCMDNKIPVDFFVNGKHAASILSDAYMQTTLWQKQALMTVEEKAILSARIIYGKLKNQLNLIKYYHKYHKKTSDVLCQKFDVLESKMQELIKKLSKYEPDNDYKKTIMGWEAMGANLYWDYIRLLISDDDVDFVSRERHGATDMVNSMLNYGYALLYSRVWQAVLYRGLNPSDSMLHERQRGKPTFVYDIIELFRTQTVDRVVVSLIQKGEDIKMDKGRLSEGTRKLLVQNIIERLNRYEVYRDKETKLCDIINMQTKEIADYIEHGKTYKPYIAKW